MLLQIFCIFYIHSHHDKIPSHFLSSSYNTDNCPPIIKTTQDGHISNNFLPQNTEQKSEQKFFHLYM